MTLPKVAILNAFDYQDLLAKVRFIFEYSCSTGLFKPGDRVLIKPNFLSAPKYDGHPVCTHPEVIKAVIKCLLDLKTKPFIGDSPAWGTVPQIAHNIGLEDFARKNSVPLIHFGRLLRIDNPNPFGPRKLFASGDVLDADHILNLPKLKAHCQMYLTLAVKNLFGCIPTRIKPPLHNWFHSREKFADFLLANALTLNPVLNILDGITAMEKTGPVNGSPVNLGILAGSHHPLCLDQITATLLNADPQKLFIENAARKHQVLPCPTEAIQTSIPLDSLEIPTFHHLQELIPLPFNPLRLVKSAIKNIFISLKR